MLEYEELRIRVRQVGPGRYLVMANGSTTATDLIVLDGQDVAHRNRFNDLIEIDLGRAPMGHQHVSTQLRKLGRDVFDLLLPPPLANCIVESLGRAQGYRPPRGLRLRFDLPPELRDLPLEALTAPSTDPQQSLALNHNLSIARSLRGGPLGTRLPDAAALPDFIDLLVAVASPSDCDLVPLEFDAELEALERALPKVAIRMTVLKGATRRSLDEWLGDHAGQPAALLLIAHGAYDDDREEGVVYLETEGGSADPISGQLLSGLLMQAHKLRLVVLNLCAGARSTRFEPFSGLAQALIGRGIPAVVAMQDDVTNDAATVFSPILLERIALNKTIDEAVTTARQHISGLPDRTAIEWATPVLFLHEQCRHGWLFKAREVRDDPDEVNDPIRESEAILALLESPGNVNRATIIAAARVLGARGDWAGMHEVAETKRPTAEQRRLVQEARVELAWHRIEQVCAALADDGEVNVAGPLMTELSSELPRGLIRCLGGELDEVQRLTALVEQAQQAEQRGDWSTAFGHYIEVLDRRPAGFRAAAQLLEQACDRVYGQGLEAEEAQDWDEAALRYGALPAEHADAGARYRYAEGRRAELATDWSTAARCYAVGPHADSVSRLAYALGRTCEYAQQWEQARAHFEAVPPHGFDAADRMLYAAGRCADQNGDWPGVIEGFGRLPDDYEHGEVGNRRRFARACMAERAGKWGSVLGHLAETPDEARDGTFGMLRRKARGQQAEMADNWTRAVEEYAPAAEANEELRRLHRYAQARADELGGDWHQALGAYAELPVEHRDVASRRAYAQARLIEDEASDIAGWQRAVDAYASLPAELEDVLMRTGYAGAQLAESKGDWDGVVREAEALGAYRDVQVLRDYAYGRRAELAQRWPDAVQAYQRCIAHLDSTGRHAYARGRVLEASGQWSAAVEAYLQIPLDLGDADDRRRRLTKLCESLPWADGLINTALVADPFALRDPAFPYLALRAAGVTPGSSTDVVKNAPYELMERGGMNFPQQVAWDQLRLLGRRLQLDALLYQFHDLDRLREQLAQLSPDEGRGLLAELCRRLPEEGPLLILLTRGREEAIAAWEERLRSSCADMAVVHSLAVAHYWQALELEESGAWELSGRAWERALVCWAALLTEDDHWTRWGQGRAGCYGHEVTPADTDRLRWELGKSLFDRLSGYAERHGGQGRLEYAQAYQELTHVLERELEGARALKAVGGLLCTEDPSSPDQGTKLVCGWAHLRVIDRERSFGELVARIEGSARDGADPGEAALRRLRCTFSELAQAFTFSEHHRFEQALLALPELHQRSLDDLPPDCAGPSGDAGSSEGLDEHLSTCGHCQDFLRGNPAYTFLPRRRARLLQDAVDLAVRAHLAIARTALTGGGGGVHRAVQEWSLAIGISERAAMTVRTKQAILRMVLGRAEALADDDGAHHGSCLDEAILLVESVLPLLGAIGTAPLKARLAVLLTDRGIWHGYGCRYFDIQPDMAVAEFDLRRAMELNPESVRARDNLVRALVFGLPDREGADTYNVKLRLLREALAILHDGLERTPAARFQNTLGDILDEVDSLLLSDLSTHDLGKLIITLGVDSGDDPVVPARELIGNAEQKLRGGDIDGALRDLVRAGRLDPASGHIRRALLDVIEQKLAESEDDGGGPG